MDRAADAVRAASEAMLMGVLRVEIRILVGKSNVSGEVGSNWEPYLQQSLRSLYDCVFDLDKESVAGTAVDSFCKFFVAGDGRGKSGGKWSEIASRNSRLGE
jgi:hypothetical protein